MVLDAGRWQSVTGVLIQICLCILVSALYSLVTSYTRHLNISHGTTAKHGVSKIEHIFFREIVDSDSVHAMM